MISEITNVVRMTLPSSPIRSIAAAAFWSLAGEITLARPPPMPLAAAITRPIAPIFPAVSRCSLVNMAIADASDPLTKPAKSPRNGAIAG
ncbi:MAG: hypothetical protein BWY06_01168 [Candidatus Latescibacteria bacterium ADurb.Bin168]|nr:MAG: hypothetical protein BWY06_01168 [Candidatus Latescibacteria bacterium ADurb.Bin168]